jgi:type I restriction enzyme S subunit
MTLFDTRIAASEAEANEINDLPEGWAPARLPEIASINMGQSPPGNTYNQQRQGLPFFQGKAEFGDRHPIPRKWCSAPTKTASPSDILISVRAPVGPTNVADQLCCIGRGLAAITPNGGLPTAFLLQFFRFIEPKLAMEGTGSTFTAINKDHLAALLVPVPPLAEQKRMAAKANELLAKVEAAKGRLAKVPALLKRFRQSVLAAACSGRLTPNAQANERDGHVPYGWMVTTISAACAQIVDCPHSTPKWTSTGRLCLRTTNFLPGALDLSEVRYVSEADYRHRISRLTPGAGDVLYSREGGILGIACQVPPKTDLCLGQRMMLLRADRSKLHPTYLMHVLNSPETNQRVRELTGGSASPHLNVGDIKEFPILLPSLPEQEEIVRRVEALFTLADAAERRVAAASARADRIAAAVLAKAFRGELVPTEAELARREGRDYEPASLLLERIRASRADAPKASRPRRRAAPASRG